tara:strand:- start:9 stop:431 length:423 start_codon:yes stop_codon:yes gene_type:complete
MLKNLSTTNMLYGIGAAIVILGALFKIQHWEGGSLLLTIGMITEAVVFAHSAFDKKEDKIISSDPYDPSAIIKAQKEYVETIEQATKNISLINKNHKEQLRLTINSNKAYKKINTEAKSLANNTYSIGKTYYSILKAMKG